MGIESSTPVKEPQSKNTRRRASNASHGSTSMFGPTLTNIGRITRIGRKKKTSYLAGSSFTSTHAHLTKQNTFDAKEGTEWLKREQTLVEAHSGRTEKNAKALFSDLSQSLRKKINLTQSGRMSVGRAGMSQPVFITTCKKVLGDEFDTALLRKLFEFMDCDKNGEVDDTEFSIVLCFLLGQGSKNSNIDLAYEIFDSNKDGGISQKEFSEMLAACCGNNLEDVLDNPQLKPAFVSSLTKNQAMENLEFYDALAPYLERNEDIPLEKALEINEIFIIEDESAGELMSERIINASAHNKTINIRGDKRRKILEEVEKCVELRQPCVPADIYRESLNEIKNILQSDCIPKFKKELRTEPFTEATLGVWEKFRKTNDEQLDQIDFNEWAQESPETFVFVEKIQKEFSIAIHNISKRNKRPDNLKDASGLTISNDI